MGWYVYDTPRDNMSGQGLVLEVSERGLHCLVQLVKVGLDLRLAVLHGVLGEESFALGLD